MLRLQARKVILVLLVLIVGCGLAVPNLFSPETRKAIEQNAPSWIPRAFLPIHAVVLGLDLQGGSHVLLEIDRAELVRSQVTQLRDDVRRILREERVSFQGGIQTTARGVQIRVPDQAERQRVLPKLRELAQPIGTLGAFGPSGNQSITVTDQPDGLIQLSVTEAGSNERVRRAVEQAMEVLRRRVDALGTTEPNIQRQGLDRILVQVPGLQDPQRLKNLLGQTAKLSFRMVDMSMSPQQALEGRPPPESDVLQGQDGQPYLVEKQVRVSGEDLVDAQAGFDQTTREPIVTFRFNSNGAKRFAAVSQEAVGRPFAIVLDNQVISAPVIREPILGGSGQISGSFSVQQANDLAILLRAGALPAPLKVVEERTVGPSLGADSIHAGKVAAYVATGLVAVFMLAVYGLFGLFALVALAVHIMLMFALQSVLGATLTLPGIAGVVLTIGMAVDSNVVIFERMRDEAREGRSAISAIDKGFVNALGTILDANITSLATAVILFLMGGSGPVRGFAVTYILGLLTTMFTAYTLTRLMIAYWVKWRRPAKLPI